jgi:hypothetical protein
MDPNFTFVIPPPENPLPTFNLMGENKSKFSSKEIDRVSGSLPEDEMKERIDVIIKVKYIS